MSDTLFTEPGTFVISVKNGIWVTLAHGLEMYGLFFKASEFTRAEDTYHARLTHCYMADRWVPIEPNGLITIPADNVAGYEWKRAKDPIVTDPDPVDLDKLRALIQEPE